MISFFNDLRNRFDFFLRSHITFSRKDYSEATNKEILENVITDYKNLSTKYNLNLLENLSARNVLENLYFLNIFDKYLTKKPNQTLSLLDIGSKNWNYVKSEYLFLSSLSNEPKLDGIELDAYRLNCQFYSRYKIAKFYTKDLKNTNYISGDFIKHKGKYDYIIWILPFITEYPLQKWGLPLKYFKPKEMLNHAFELLKEGGEILIINQGEEEYKIQQDLNKKLNIQTEYYSEAEDKLNLFKNKRFVSKIIKVQNTL